jgi:hypothetical protein
VALDGEDGTTAQRDQDTTSGTAAVELPDGYKPWEDAALDNEPLLHGAFGTNKILLNWLEDHEISYDVPTLQYFRGLIGMHQSGHPSIPPQTPVFTRPQLPFEYSLQSSYDKEVAGFCADFADDPKNALELSKLLYDLNPIYDPVRSADCPKMITQLGYLSKWTKKQTTTRIQHKIAGYETSLAVLARFLLNASDSFTCVMPVSVTDLRVSSSKLVTKPWALYIRLYDGTETFLPVALRLAGPSPHIQQSGKGGNDWSQEPDILEKFEPYPILSVSDIEHFDRYSATALSSLPWDLRRYRSTIAYAKPLRRATPTIGATREVPRTSRIMKY